MSKTKSEIDKELMYKKLMPSAARTVRLQTPEPEPERSPRKASPQPVPPSISQKAPEPRRIAVPTLDSRQTVVVNTMEACVLGKLEEVLERFSCCRCDRCKKDIVALALNKLPPRYMVLAQGQPEPDVSPQVNAQVIAAMIQAVIRVRSHPRH